MNLILIRACDGKFELLNAFNLKIPKQKNPSQHIFLMLVQNFLDFVRREFQNKAALLNRALLLQILNVSDNPITRFALEMSLHNLITPTGKWMFL